MQILTNTTKNWVKTPIVLWTIISTLFMMTGFYVALQTNTASAAALTVVSDTIDTPLPATLAAHSFTFTLATALSTGAAASTQDFNFFLQFPRATGADPFTINALLTGDVTVTCSSGCGATPTFATTAVILGNLDSGDDAQNDNIKVEVDNTNNDSRSMTSGAVFTVVIDNAPGITNPAEQGAAGDGVADFWQIDIETREDATNTTVDTGTSGVAIIEGVNVSVTVDESLSFTIAGVVDTTCATITNGVGTERTTTPTSVPFAGVTTEAFYDGCLQLSVNTNAVNGYTATIQQDGLLTSGGNTIAEGTCDGTCSDTAIAAWNTATNNGFAYCMRDSTGNAAATADAGWTSGANQCGGTTQGFKTFPTVTATEDIMESAGTLTAADVSQVAFRISVSGTQANGTYQNEVEFVATPVF